MDKFNTIRYYVAGSAKSDDTKERCLHIGPNNSKTFSFQGTLDYNNP